VFPGNGKPRWSDGRIAELERKVGQQALEIDLLKGRLRVAAASSADDFGTAGAISRLEPVAQMPQQDDDASEVDHSERSCRGETHSGSPGGGSASAAE